MANCILLTRDNCSQAHEDMANYGLDACPVCGQELEPAKKQAFLRLQYSENLTQCITCAIITHGGTSDDC